ncbi:hypothetical protein Scep_022270 [Stephania cephalantha]|uniref:Uncharacterized protein n=1 Tax=Stephania cephalantha TaxID=152367 RepID=A0AAP0F531_9MAGN
MEVIMISHFSRRILSTFRECMRVARCVKFLFLIGLRIQDLLSWGEKYIMRSQSWDELCNFRFLMGNAGMDHDWSPLWTNLPTRGARELRYRVCKRYYPDQTHFDLIERARTILIERRVLVLWRLVADGVKGRRRVERVKRRRGAAIVGGLVRAIITSIGEELIYIEDVHRRIPNITDQVIDELIDRKFVVWFKSYAKDWGQTPTAIELYSDTHTDKDLSTFALGKHDRKGRVCNFSSHASLSYYGTSTAEPSRKPSYRAEDGHALWEEYEELRAQLVRQMQGEMQEEREHQQKAMQEIEARHRQDREALTPVDLNYSHQPNEDFVVQFDNDGLDGYGPSGRHGPVFAPLQFARRYSSAPTKAKTKDLQRNWYSSSSSPPPLQHLNKTSPFISPSFYAIIKLKKTCNEFNGIEPRSDTTVGFLGFIRSINYKTILTKTPTGSESNSIKNARTHGDLGMDHYKDRPRHTGSLDFWGCRDLATGLRNTRGCRQPAMQPHGGHGAHVEIEPDLKMARDLCEGCIACSRLYHTLELRVSHVGFSNNLHCPISIVHMALAKSVESPTCAFECSSENLLKKNEVNGEKESMEDFLYDWCSPRKACQHR